ncbi:MAG: 6-phosphogluconate dehydrogenase (decarboxylating) [Nanoarchaeota archaeon]|nr:6-phosphogluconate dehydrogenase (decarboxylating) [Nanoarchaeota archaeon]|tara:strand:+ start:1877 stop:2764 length:888 start_codon:yes stop_codon:yes gene_type:complete
MKLGFIGLGRMGENMCLHLLEKKHKLVVNDLSKTQIQKLSRKGATPAYSLEEVTQKLSGKKVIWLMIPAGKPVDDTISKLLPSLNKGDILIDGGNSYFKDSIKRSQMLKKKGIYYLDCGTSGGISGARNGACMMVGGEKKIFKKIEKLFRDMCVKDGYGYMGESGAGHFVKMVHNGIEYGMMGALAEGMNAIKKSKFKSDLKEVAKVYAHGSIIESRLTSWMQEGMKRPYYSKISGSVPRGETEGEMENLEKLAPMKVLEQARKLRVKSRSSPGLIGKLIAVMRNEFGGHKFKKK